MRTSVWYRTEEKQPGRSGYYLTYRGWGMGGKGDGDSDHGYLYYHLGTDKWYNNANEVRAMHPRTAIVYYWTDATPDDWPDQDPPRSQLQQMKQTQCPALLDAWKDVAKAVEKYNIIRKLTT